MTKLILVRHGYSEMNKTKCFGGNTDAPLSDIGIMQAKACAKYIKSNFKIDVVYASDLKRAYGTGEEIAKECGVCLIADKGLREIYGGKWEGMDFSKLGNDYPEEYDKWINDFGHAVCPDGESVKHLYNRITEHVLDLMSKNEGKTVVCATHATPIRALCAMMSGKGADGMQETDWVANASVSVCEYEKGKLFPIVLGIDTFLGEMKTSLPKGV